MSTAEEETPVTCMVCGKKRTSADGKYHPMQLLVGTAVGWYSGEDGEICGKDMMVLMLLGNHSTQERE